MMRTFLRVCALLQLCVMRRTAAFDPYGGMLLLPKLEPDHDGLGSAANAEVVADSKPAPTLEPDPHDGLGSVAKTEAVADSEPPLERSLDESSLLLMKAESEFQDSHDRHATLHGVVTLTDDSDDAADAALADDPAADAGADADTDSDAAAPGDDWLATVPWRAGKSSNAKTQERRHRSNNKKRNDPSYRNQLTHKRRERQHRREGRDLHSAFGDSTTTVPDCFQARRPLPAPPKAPPPPPQKKARPPPMPPPTPAQPPLMPTQPACAPPLHLILPPPPPPPVPAYPPRPPMHPPLQAPMTHGSVGRVIIPVPEPVNGPRRTCAASSSSSSPHMRPFVAPPKMSMEMMIKTLTTMNFLVNAVNVPCDQRSP